MNILLNGKPAYKINATLLTQTDSALYLDFEGDRIWVPKKLCKYNAGEKTVIITDWFYKQKFGEK